MTFLDKKKYISIAISILVLILLVLFGIYPLAKKIINNAEEFMAEKNKFAELTQRQENFRELSRQYNNYKEELDKIDSLFINSEKPIEFIEFLERNSRDLNLEMDISSITPKKLDQNSWSFNIYNIVLEGSFDDFSKFLEKMENAPYLIEISNLDIQEGRANLGLKVYCQ